MGPWPWPGSTRGCALQPPSVCWPRRAHFRAAPQRLPWPCPSVLHSHSPPAHPQARRSERSESYVPPHLAELLTIEIPPSIHPHEGTLGKPDNLHTKLTAASAKARQRSRWAVFSSPVDAPRPAGGGRGIQRILGGKLEEARGVESVPWRGSPWQRKFGCRQGRLRPSLHVCEALPSPPSTDRATTPHPGG